MGHSQLWGILFYFLSLPFCAFALSAIWDISRLYRFPSFRSIDGKGARVAGKVRSLEELRTPISNEPCCWYEASVSSIKPSASAIDTTPVATSFESSALIPFFIDSTNGTVLIDPLRLSIKDQSRRTFWRRSSAKDMALANSTGFKLDRKSKLSIDERWIPNGAEVVLIGTMSLDMERETFANDKRFGGSFMEHVVAPFKELQALEADNPPIPRLKGFVESEFAPPLMPGSVGGPDLVLYRGSVAEVTAGLCKQLLIALAGAAGFAAVGYKLF